MTKTPASGDRLPTRGAGARHAPGTRSGRYAAVLALCAGCAYILDLLTKTWVTQHMDEGQSIAVLPPVLHWHFIRNPGAAFSIGTDFTWVFTIIMVLVVTGIIVATRNVRSWGWAVALGLVLGGALGNLTDRLFREPSFGQGHVVDFIALPHFAIFNIADSAVVSGVVLLCILTLRGIDMGGGSSTESIKSEESDARSGGDGKKPQENPEGV